MGRRQKNYTEENVLITGFAAEGKAFGKINNKIVFIPYAAPGDIVNVRITRNKTSFFEGQIESIVKYSDERIEPFCKHFGVCGGCKWQHIPYEKQLEYKQKQVNDQLKHIGNVEAENCYPIIASERTKFYRNKLEFTFSPKGWLTNEELKSGKDFAPALGFHMTGKFDKVLDISKCDLQDDLANKIRNEVRDFALINNITFHNLVSHEGLLRTMFLRNNSKNEFMLIITFNKQEDNTMELIANHMLNKFNEIVSLVFIVNSKLNDSIEGLKPYKIYGSEFITEKLDHLNFRLGPFSFFQTNTNQAVNMYRKVNELCNLKGTETVYDLYTGTGTIANYIAPNAKKVVGIEYIEEAIEHAKVNSEINHIKNTVFIHGDMKFLLNENTFGEHGKPDVIITDPPRAGMHNDVVDTILKSGVERIVYVSCNPATQARDLKTLCTKYKLVSVQAIDMFPHTYHVENIALLTLI